MLFTFAISLLAAFFLPSDCLHASELTHTHPNIGISSDDQALSTKILNTILSDEFVLLTKTLNYHWNVVGPEFHDYHILFNKQYDQIFAFIDEIAERARFVGGIALGTMAKFIQHATLKEDNGPTPSPQQMIVNLLADREALIVNLRTGINVTAENNRDMGTSDFLTGLLKEHEKIAWFLRSLVPHSK